VVERVCENCGFADPELTFVRRVYVVPEDWDRPGTERVVEPPELWCVSCLTQYPCRAADPDDPGLATP
jgi:hypothetical protein